MTLFDIFWRGGGRTSPRPEEDANRSPPDSEGAQARERQKKRAAEVEEEGRIMVVLLEDPPVVPRPAVAAESLSSPSEPPSEPRIKKPRGRPRKIRSLPLVLEPHIKRRRGRPRKIEVKEGQEAAVEGELEKVEEPLEAEEAPCSPTSAVLEVAKRLKRVEWDEMGEEIAALTLETRTSETGETVCVATCLVCDGEAFDVRNNGDISVSEVFKLCILFSFAVQSYIWGRRILSGRPSNYDRCCPTVCLRGLTLRKEYLLAKCWCALRSAPPWRWA